MKKKKKPPRLQCCSHIERDSAIAQLSKLSNKSPSKNLSLDKSVIIENPPEMIENPPEIIDEFPVVGCINNNNEISVCNQSMQSSVAGCSKNNNAISVCNQAIKAKSYGPNQTKK